MTTIRSLFDPQRGIQRSIEKVISYQASQEQRLRAEITEYIVTESIERQLERLLENMQAAMEAGGGHEVGVWVSGFYGSGKSSFTKYLGLAFDERVKVDGQPFLRHLQDRLHKPQTKALLSAVASRFPAAVVMLDLATEQIAGATLAEVSTVLYYKVLQYAGYSRNLKVAALERKLKKDGRFSEFEALFSQQMGVPWADYQNDPLVVDSVLPPIARRMYPVLFRSDQAFSTESSDVIYLMDDRVQEMLDIVRESTGKDHIVFVIDEVGQYVGISQNKILDLQGLAENLKNIGQGKVWVIGTAQQTLTEDDPRAAINSPQLFKLKDRFPIPVELESSDIKEICYRRLLAKSTSGADEIGALFDRHGQALRHHTRLVDAKYYDANYDRTTFVNLYPFLPAHFDILLHLLGALAKSTGGVGLRSAIKVIQDILVEGSGNQPPVADQELGWLATTSTLYDSLERDIHRAFPSIRQAVEKVCIRYPDEPLKQDIGKTVAVLQILGNLPVSVQNVASLLHPKIDAQSLGDTVKEAVDVMLRDPLVPLGENEGNLRFFSEKLNDVEKERGQLALRSADLRRIFNEALREVFEPLPSARVNGTLTVTSGVKHLSSGQAASLAGERETIQTVVVFAESADYDGVRTRTLDESRQRSSEHTIYLLGRTASDAQNLVNEIFRCQRIVEIHRGDPDQEVKDYCNGQTERAARLANELGGLLRRSLAQGSFVFRGSATAVDSLDQTLVGAAKKLLADAAGQIFDRYQEAPERAPTDLAEKFLRAASANLRSVSSQLDPLGLVKVSGTAASIDNAQKALVSIRDHIERTGTIEGKRLLEVFSGPPFGWSPDTARYLVAGLLIAGEIKFKVSGREVTVVGQQAIDALKTNNSFRSVGVSLRHDRPSMDVLVKAAERLTELAGEQVLPLEAEIGKAARRFLPRLQHRLAPLEEKLAALSLPGADVVQSANQQISDLLLSDGSDSPQRFGAEESSLYDGLKWGQAVRVAFDQGLGETVRELRELGRAVGELPATGAPGELRDQVQEDLGAISERLAQSDFFDHKADFRTKLTGLKTRIADTAHVMAKTQAQRLRDAEQDLRILPEWSELTSEEQNNALAEIERLALAASEDMAGLKKLIARQFDIETTIGHLKARIVAQARERRQREFEAASAGVRESHRKARRELVLPRRIATTAELDAVIHRLDGVRVELPFTEFDIVVDKG